MLCRIARAGGVEISHRLLSSYPNVDEPAAVGFFAKISLVTD
jgi:hypothetical protein